MVMTTATMSKRLAECLFRIIDALTPRQQEAIRLVQIEGRAIADAARETGSTPNTFSHALHAGYERIRSEARICSDAKCPTNNPLPDDCPAECMGFACLKYEILMNL